MKLHNLILKIIERILSLALKYKPIMDSFPLNLSTQDGKINGESERAMIMIIIIIIYKFFLWVAIIIIIN